MNKSTSKKSGVKSEEKKNELDIGKMGLGVIALMVMFPMAYPNVNLPSLSNIASIIENAGYVLFTGGGVYLGLDVISKIKNNNKEDK